MTHSRSSRRHCQLLFAASAAILTLIGTTLSGAPTASAAGQPRGHDVSSHQKDVDWAAVRSKGAAFVYVKATESTSYRNPYFEQQYGGSRKVGMVRGAYHFAVPDQSSGQAQAAYFLKHGGAGRPDGWTLPPALDLENYPRGRKKCYGLDPREMVAWITSFSDEVRRVSGRRPVIYTTTKWWNDCTAGSTAFGADHPLWLARWADSPGPLPAGWQFWTFWQYSNAGDLPGDQNVFNGTDDQLKRLAGG
ncbi:lysozyme [Streptomyces sp. URMC 123]|uniref:lysozyme n=1 Tax=Streptomyces sp. URMC 123 TaxID=3423403 RepID=UPI003F1CA78A